VLLGGKHGFIDQQGKMVIKPLYEWDSDRAFYDGLVQVYREDKFEILDRTGKLIWREP